MVLNSFSAGVNTSFSSELNQNVGEQLAFTLRTLREVAPTGNIANDFASEADIASSQYNTLDQATVTTTNGWYDSGLGLYFFGYNYDDYDSSVNATKWTGSGDGSNSETTSYVQRAYSASSQTAAKSLDIVASGSSTSANVYPASGTTSEGALKVYINATGSGNSKTVTATLYLTDGSTNIVLVQNQTTVSSGATIDDTYFYKVDSSGNTITIYTTYGGAGTEKDISTLSGTDWYFKAEATITSGISTNPSLTARFYSIVYVNGSGGVTIPTSDMETTATTTNESNSKSLVAYYGEGLTVSTSNNGGSNYTAAPNKTLVSNTAGNSFQIKIEPSSTSPNALPKFDELVGISLL